MQSVTDIETGLSVQVTINHSARRSLYTVYKTLTTQPIYALLLHNIISEKIDDIYGNSSR